MSITAALALQSLPFAGLALVTMNEHRDLFLVVYVAALGLVLATTAIMDGHYAIPLRLFGLDHEPHR